MSGPVLVDTDPGTDDALAFHYLGATGGWDLKAITVVAGKIFVATLDVQATLQ
jgi:inosine-uridine nucleoside N-ribohydrolase